MWKVTLKYFFHKSKRIPQGVYYKTAVYYGNNTRTNYLYDFMQRLENMKSYINGESQLIQDLTYSYDNIGNITSVENSAGIHSSGLGGRYTNTYEYDDLYRLKASKGEFSGHEIFYKNSLSMSYENNGRIKNKNYSEIRLPMTIGGGSALHSTDNLVYNYNTSQPNTLKTVSRLRPNLSYSFTWDANGNMTKYSAKVMGWDEENRMTAAGDNSYNSYYSYDNTGDRTYKLTGERKYLYVNGVGKYYNKLTTPTLYVFPYVVATSTGYTKHIYSGNERIVSKIGTGGLSRVHNHIKQQAEWQPKQELSKLQLKRTMENGINRPVEESDITGNSLSIIKLSSKQVLNIFSIII